MEISIDKIPNLNNNAEKTISRYNSFTKKFYHNQKYLKCKKNLSYSEKLGILVYFSLPTIFIYGLLYENKIRKVPLLVQVFFLFNYYKFCKFMMTRFKIFKQEIGMFD